MPCALPSVFYNLNSIPIGLLNTLPSQRQRPTFLWKWKFLSPVWLFVTPCDPPYSPWNSLDQNTGVGCFFLLQGIFPTQGSNPGHPHCRQILYQLSYKGSPKILEWVANPFSRGSSQPRNQTKVFCTASGFFTNWAQQIRMPIFFFSIHLLIFLAWKVPWTEEPGELQSTGSQRVGYNWATEKVHLFI